MSRICHSFMVWCGVLRTGFGGPLCAKKSRATFWPQSAPATEGSKDCWANHWYNPPHSPRNVLVQSEQKGWQNHSGPLTSSTLPLWAVTIWSMLQSSEHQNDQTQKQFLPPSNPSHEHLTLNVEHTTLLYNFLFTTHTFFFLQICTSDLTQNCLYCILCFCHFVHYLFVYCSFVVWVLSCCCHSVALLSFCHYN